MGGSYLYKKVEGSIFSPMSINSKFAVLNPLHLKQCYSDHILPRQKSQPLKAGFGSK